MNVQRMSNLSKFQKTDEHLFFENKVKEKIICLGKFTHKMTLYSGFYENYNVSCCKYTTRESLFRYSILYVIALIIN